MECLYQIPPITVQGTLWKGKQKKGESQRGLRPPRKQALNQQDYSHTNSETEAGLFPGLYQVLCTLFYGLQFSVLTEFLSLQMSRYLTPEPSLGLFSFCSFVLSNFEVIVLLCFIYYPLEACFFSSERQKGS